MIEGLFGLIVLFKGEMFCECVLEVFFDLCVWDMEYNNGVLIYVLLVDRCVEIVVDWGILLCVIVVEWEVVCCDMEIVFCVGDFKWGVLVGIEIIGWLLSKYFFV